MLGLLVSPMQAGATGVLDRRFSASQFWDRVRAHGATTVTLVGAMIMMVWNLPRRDEDADGGLRVFGGAPIPIELWHAIEDRYRCTISTAYGQTEAFPLCQRDIARPTIPGSVGHRNPRFDVRVVDDAGEEVPNGTVGEVVCRPLEPPAMSDGYWNRPDATAQQTRDLWWHTGDLARVDDDGNLFFSDRKKDSIRRRGENISSFEVEQAILTHPAVAEVAAHAVPSELTEDEVKVCVVVQPGATLTPEELIDHCVASMPYFAVPRYVEFLDDLPKNAVGRVLKFELRARGITPTTWDREAAG